MPKLVGHASSQFHSTPRSLSGAIVVRNALQTGTDQGAFLRSVQDVKDRASLDLQRNVFKNYHEFVALSKEIAKVRPEDVWTGRRLA